MRHIGIWKKSTDLLFRNLGRIDSGVHHRPERASQFSATTMVESDGQRESGVGSRSLFDFAHRARQSLRNPVVRLAEIANPHSSLVILRPVITDETAVASQTT